MYGLVFSILLPQPLEPWNYRGRLGTGVTDCHVIKQPRTSCLRNSQLRSFSHTGKSLMDGLSHSRSLVAAVPCIEEPWWREHEGAHLIVVSSYP